MMHHRARTCLHCLAVLPSVTLGATVIAAPPSRPRVEVNPDRSSAALITGSGDHLNALIAGGGATAKIELYPIPAPVGSYPAGTQINDVFHNRPSPLGLRPYNEIAFPPGLLPSGRRIWAEILYSGWDPDGNDILDGTGLCEAGTCTEGRFGDTCVAHADCDRPTMGVGQVYVNKVGMLDADVDGDGDTSDDGNQADITFAFVSCPSSDAAGNAHCAATFGTPDSRCFEPGSVYGCPYAFCCEPLSFSPSNPRPDNICAGVSCNAACDTYSPSFTGCFATAQSPQVFHDSGTKRFGGTLVLDVPVGAIGRYYLDLDLDATFMGDSGSPPNIIPLVEVSGLSVLISQPAAPVYRTRAARSLPITAEYAPEVPQSPSTGIQVRMIDLQSPTPPNPPCCDPPDFGAYESATCTAAGELNGCIRWVGPAFTVFEQQGDPAKGVFTGARLQCTPYYANWLDAGLVDVFGSEIVPSSTYEWTVFDSSCAGNEVGCTAASVPVVFRTARWGDVATPQNPPAISSQPDGLDVVAMVNAFRNVFGALSKTSAQTQPDAIELNADVNALDIVGVVDAFRGLAYPFSGPCPCPSTVACNVTPCALPSACSGGLCVRTCTEGANADLPCVTSSHCPGGSCPSSGYCRDRCGRCQ